MASAGRILIMPKGNYDSSATYEMLDMVSHNGKTWLAKKTVSNIEPSTANSEYWHDLVDITPETIGALSLDGGMVTGHIYRTREVEGATYRATYSPSTYKVGGEIASGVMHYSEQSDTTADSILLFNKNGVELMDGLKLLRYKIYSELNKPQASDIGGLEDFIKQVIANNK